MNPYPMSPTFRGFFAIVCAPVAVVDILVPLQHAPGKPGG
jgi:hypothetical protein